MAIDKDRRPMLYSMVNAMATSVPSGLVLAALLGILRIGAPPSGGIAWIVLIIIATGGLAFGVLSAVQGFRYRHRSKRIFLVTSAFDQKYFVAAFIRRMYEALDRHDIELVLKVPYRDYDAGVQSQQLRRLASRRREYIGGVIVPSEVQRLRPDLVTFCDDSRLPIVFTDLEPFDRESDYPAQTAFAGFVTGDLGELAGRWLVQNFQRTKNLNPYVLMIASREHSERQRRCESILRESLPRVMVQTDDTCEFVRLRAYESTRRHIEHLDPRQSLDAIFCTNDEMALGAVDAIRAAESDAVKHTVVIGIDGVAEARNLIDNSDSPLRATVVQDTKRIANCIVDLLIKMHDSQRVPPRTILPPTIYERTTGKP